MMQIDAAVEEHVRGFIAMLDETFRRWGSPNGLPTQLKDAVLATPRHRFVHRFRHPGDFHKDGSDPLRDFEADPIPSLSVIYSDRVLIHVDANGEALPSSNSQPSFVLWLVDMLGLERGHRVLEIGSGSSWLAAVMARLVGENGHVTGIEIISDLAEQSRGDLAGLGIDHVRILTADGTRGHAEDAPYDRIMITASTWDLPATLFDQIADGGRILVPIALRGGGGCHVTMLRREGDRLISEGSVPGWFVPLVGPSQHQIKEGLALETLPFWGEIAKEPVLRCPFWLGTNSDGHFWASVAAFFAGFLAKTEPGFAVFDKGLRPDEYGRAPFGLTDEKNRSVALCQPGELVCYGSLAAAQSLAQAYVAWTNLSMPASSAFDLEVVKSTSAPIAGGDDVWVEHRGDSTLIWRVKEGSRSWCSLLSD